MIMKYNITIWFSDGFKEVLIVNYDKEYELQSHIIGIGKNGILLKEKMIYYPPHKIDKITFEKLS